VKLHSARVEAERPWRASARDLLRYRRDAVMRIAPC
jgi:hypothetical protein